MLAMPRWSLAGLFSVALAFAAPAFAVATDAPNYFIFDGNPVAAKYISRTLIHLPAQDGATLDDLKQLESVAALSRAPYLHLLTKSAAPLKATISKLQQPEYGLAMFEVAIDGQPAGMPKRDALLWSGQARFREVALRPQAIDARLKTTLIGRSLRERKSDRVHGQIKFGSTPTVKDHGRTAAAPHLAFIDIIWKIADDPTALSSRGIDLKWPFIRDEFVIDTRDGRTIYRHTSTSGETDPSDMRLFAEPGGPLLMAVPLYCDDGAETLILDLEHDTFGTGSAKDVPDVPHCFPAH